MEGNYITIPLPIQMGMKLSNHRLLVIKQQTSNRIGKGTSGE